MLHYQKLFEVSQNLRNKDIDIAELRKTNEYNEFENFFKNNFNWKIGKYTGTISCIVANRSKVFKQSFEFYLSNAEIRLLESNKQICIEILDNHFIRNDPEFKPFWQWAYPSDISNKNSI